MSNYVTCSNCGYPCRSQYNCARCGQYNQSGAHLIAKIGFAVFFLLAIGAFFGSLLLCGAGLYRTKKGIPNARLMAMGGIALGIIAIGGMWYNSINPFYGDFESTPYFHPDMVSWFYWILGLNLIGIILGVIVLYSKQHINSNMEQATVPDESVNQNQ